MAKQKCQACGEMIDSGLVLCPSCNCDPNRPRETTLTPDQLNQLAKDVKKDIWRSIFFWLGVLSLIFGYGLWQTYTSATKFMEKLLIERISQEFEQPRISATVQEVAATEGKRLLQEQIKPEVAKFKKETEASVTETKQLIQSAQTNLNDLTNMIELEDAARYGSRKAFSRLVQLGESSDSLGTMAKRRALIIQRELLILRSVPEAYMGIAMTTPDGKKQDANKLSTSELFLWLESLNMPKEYIPSLMADIAAKPKKEVSLEAKQILQSSDSLWACAATCGILKKVLGDKAPFLAFEDWIKVCEEELSKEK